MSAESETNIEIKIKDGQADIIIQGEAIDIITELSMFLIADPQFLELFKTAVETAEKFNNEIKNEIK